MYDDRMIRNLLQSVVLVWCLLMGGGCSTTPEDRIAERPELFAGYSMDIQEKIRHGVVSVGFDKDMVWMALGKAHRIQTRREAAGLTSEVWSYLGTYYLSMDSHHGGLWYYPRHGRRYGPAYYYGPHFHRMRHEYERLRLTFQKGKVAVIEEDLR